MTQTQKLTWANSGYECSSKGDKRFSALYAKMPDGRTIEMWYQCDIKGYFIGGTDWKFGKGKPAIFPFTREQQFDLYVGLWRHWVICNGNIVQEMAMIARRDYAGCLTDSFAGTNPINQANALVHIINDWNL
jgi:hypothetical protein